MKTDESASRIALQPESEVEQALLAELFDRLVQMSDAPKHPQKVGSQLVFYTLDVDQYDGLDHDLWDDADCDINEHGQLDPEAGSRALVVIHDYEAEQPDEEAVDKAVESLKEGSDEDNEYTVSVPEAFEEADRVLSLEDPDYREDLQEAAKMISTTGYDIPANLSSEELVAHIQDFHAVVKEEINESD